MSKAIAHPRRLGFVAFNAVTLLLLALWLAVATSTRDAGIAGLPNLALTNVAIVLLVAVWIGCWIAWSVMVWSRAQRRR
jgi:hypothetical protein